MSSQSFLQDLNESQQEAVLHTQGALLVLAGAGSGKTKVIVSKILYLLSLGFEAKNILALTFTNKAAREMKERIKEPLENKAKKLTITTFHSLGLQILKEEYGHLSYFKDFSIFDRSDQEALMKEIFLQLKINQEDYSIEKGLYKISQAKNALKTAKHSFSEPFKNIYSLYEQQLKLNNAFDLDDLVFQPILLFQKNEALLKKWASQYRYILVDEYQDSNFSQACFLKQLSSVHQNICVVGDDDQSIYGFRGADVGNILRFSKDFQVSKQVVLNINYRNSFRILESAYKIIENNQDRHHKEIKSIFSLSEAEKIHVYSLENPEKEAEWIAQKIFTNRIENKIPYDEQAILCRTNQQIRILEKALRAQGIDYIVVGAHSFFERSEIKTVLAYLKLIQNPLDHQSFYRVAQFPKRGIGEKLLEKISDYAMKYQEGMFDIALRAENIEIFTLKEKEKLSEFAWQIQRFKEKNERLSLSDFVAQLFQEFDFQKHLVKLYKEESDKRVQALNDLYSMIRSSENQAKKEGNFYHLDKFLHEIVLQSLKEEDQKQEKKAVFIITIHSSKGLEYDTVFIPGFEEEMFPHKRALGSTEKAIDEERRLCYVAFTRARKYLYLTYCQIRKVHKEEKCPSISRFLDDIPEEHLEIWDQEKQEQEFQEKGGAFLYLEKMKEIAGKKDYF